MSAFRSLVVKETRHILRDRQTLGVLLALPVVMVLLFGYAIRTDVQDVRVLVVDAARDGQSLDLTRAVAATPALRLVGVDGAPAAIEPALRTGRASVALVLPAAFGASFARGTAEVLVVTDGTTPNYAAAAEGYVRQVVQTWAAQQGARAPTVRVAARMRFNPEMKSEALFVPGLLAYVLTLVSALMTALSISREKESGTMDVLLVSPLRPGAMVIGKVAPYLVLAFVNALTALAVARFVFHVPMRGSLAALLVATLAYVLGSLALGVLISSKTPDQRTAMMGTLLGLLLPTLALSGFVFPISSMPAWIRPVTQIVPATWYILAARGAMLKGLGFAGLAKELIVLFAMAAVLLVAASRSLKDRLE